MAKGSFKLSASKKAVDPTLDALFSGSSGPVKPNPKSKYTELLPERPDPEDDAEEDEDASMEDVDGLEDASEPSEDEAETKIEEKLLAPPKKTKERKRKRDEGDDIESRYLNKLAEEEERDEQKKKQKKALEAKETEVDEDDDTSSDEEDDEEESSEEQDASEGSDAEEASEDVAEEEEDSDDEIPVHESVAAAKAKKDTPAKDEEVEKANRTVFLSNVSAEASTSKTAKRTLLDHLSKVLAENEKIESIRFRSLAFSTGAIPKRAAYITSAVMDSTTKSANAYVVYSTPAAARKAFAELNGTVVLDRHLRVDSVAHPSPVDHRRCVFVGNLGFVDDETVVNTNSAGETSTRKRTKTPADTEEGLWRTFGKHAGKVENVRVVRDPKTRVGKGFAYVQFYSENDVEAALLLNGKKYPPMLPRILRVVRAKAPHKTALAQEQRKNKLAAAATLTDGDKKSTKYKHKATPEQQSHAGRAAKLLGRSGGIRELRKASGKADRREKGSKPAPGNGSGVVPKTPEQFIFEGRRASANDGRPNDVRIGGKKKRVGKKGRIEKPGGRSTARAESWKQKQKKKD